MAFKKQSKVKLSDNTLQHMPSIEHCLWNWYVMFSALRFISQIPHQLHRS